MVDYEDFPADAPPYTSFFGVMGITAAMSFCGESGEVSLSITSLHM